MTTPKPTKYKKTVKKMIASCDLFAVEVIGLLILGSYENGK
ncbi:MAG: hypothetical protein ACXVCP_05005 [Bdellovibrio sp.]